MKGRKEGFNIPGFRYKPCSLYAGNLRVFLINFQGTREISSIYRGIHYMPCSLYPRYPSSTVLSVYIYI